jgi:hypothetical protein
MNNLLKRLKKSEYCMAVDEAELKYLEIYQLEYNKIVDNTADRFEELYMDYERLKGRAEIFEYEVDLEMNLLINEWEDTNYLASEYINLNSKKSLIKLTNYIETKNVEIGENNMIYDAVNGIGVYQDLEGSLK